MAALKIIAFKTGTLYQKLGGDYLDKLHPARAARASCNGSNSSTQRGGWLVDDSKSKPLVRPVRLEQF